jgi:hypothetical protein
MPCACSICSHPDRRGIETAVYGGTPLRTIARRWSVSKTALLRHRDTHVEMVPGTPLQAPVPQERPRISPTSAPNLAALESTLRHLHQQLHLALKEPKR